MNHLVLLRHGQSVWNLENRFTGWVDVDLTEKGEAEAAAAGARMAKAGLVFDAVLVSNLKRAQRTAAIALDAMRAAGADVSRIAAGDGWTTAVDERLNERDYGDLAGLNKAETAAKHGEEQVRIWRRSFDAPPPGGESLKDVVARVGPYFETVLKPRLAAGETLLVAAHGNSLRALLVALGEHAAEDIASVEVPTGSPLAFDMNGAEKASAGVYLKG